MIRQPAYVGIDLHRRRSAIVRKDQVGTVLATVCIDNDPVALAAVIGDVGPEPKVAMEATGGWYWAADVIEACGASLLPSHPKGNDWGRRRVKNDVRDAEDLADLLRRGRLAEAWIAPKEIRELRELTRYRLKLRCYGPGFRCQVHSVFAKEGVPVPMTDMFGKAGQDLLDRDTPLSDAYALRVESLRDRLEIYDREMATVERKIAEALDGHEGYDAIQDIPGVGQILGAVFVAEIGDISRFSTPPHLASWAGLTPRHRESDTNADSPPPGSPPTSHRLPSRLLDKRRSFRDGPSKGDPMSVRGQNRGHPRDSSWPPVTRISGSLRGISHGRRQSSATGGPAEGGSRLRPGAYPSIGPRPAP